MNHFILNNKGVEILETQSKPDSISESHANESLYIKGQNDALRWYNDTRPGTGTLVISLLSPLAGLIPAIACSSTQPRDKNLNYRNLELIKNQEYYSGYANSSKKIKKKRVWTNWGVAFGVNVVAVLIIYTHQ